MNREALTAITRVAPISNAIILQFISPSVEIERIGVGAAWREKVRVMFRLRGAERPA